MAWRSVRSWLRSAVGAVLLLVAVGGGLAVPTGARAETYVRDTLDSVCQVPWWLLATSDPADVVGLPPTLQILLPVGWFDASGGGVVAPSDLGGLDVTVADERGDLVAGDVSPTPIGLDEVEPGRGGLAGAFFWRPRGPLAEGAYTVTVRVSSPPEPGGAASVACAARAGTRTARFTVTATPTAPRISLPLVDVRLRRGSGVVVGTRCTGHAPEDIAWCEDGKTCCWREDPDALFLSVLADVRFSGVSDNRDDPHVAVVTADPPYLSGPLVLLTAPFSSPVGRFWLTEDLDVGPTPIAAPVCVTARIYRVDAAAVVAEARSCVAAESASFVELDGRIGCPWDACPEPGPGGPDVDAGVADPDPSRDGATPSAEPPDPDPARGAQGGCAGSSGASGGAILGLLIGLAASRRRRAGRERDARL